MNKLILGGILAAISLMAIYGTSSSEQVISVLDGPNSPKTQSNFGQNTNENGPVALNTTESAGTRDGAFVESGVQAPLEKAGTFPQRQTVESSRNFGPATTPDDTDNQVIEAPDSTETAPTTGGTTTTPPAATTTPAQNPTPIPALW